MGKNKKENFIFTLICCALMVLGMDLYNVILREGYTSTFISDVLIGFIPIFCIALIMDWFIIGKIAKGLVAKILIKNSSLLKKILFTSFFMVCGMCFSITLLVSIIHQGISSNFLGIFIGSLWRNFICALPLQLIVVGPIARTIFFKIYPIN